MEEAQSMSLFIQALQWYLAMALADDSIDQVNKILEQVKCHYVIHIVIGQCVCLPTKPRFCREKQSN